MDIKDFIGDKAKFDEGGGGYIWGCNGDKIQMIAEVRGWGAIQNLFKANGAIDEATAGKFQDEIGEFIASAITEKLERERKMNKISQLAISNIVLIQRDGGKEYKWVDVAEEDSYSNKNLCHLKAVGGEEQITLNLFHILNALNTPNGVWSIKIPADKKYIYDTEVWVRGKMLAENGREGLHDTGGSVTDMIGFNECGHERQISIRRTDQLKKRVFQ